MLRGVMNVQANKILVGMSQSTLIAVTSGDPASSLQLKSAATLADLGSCCESLSNRSTRKRGKV
jgi:hypothetical protein